MNHIIILAGGKGTRMKSEKPKVLTLVKGIPIIKRLLANIKSICEKPTIIVGYKGNEVVEATENKYNYVIQKEQNGTGHAIACAKSSLQNKNDIESIIVIPGDHPLVSAQSLNNITLQRKSSGAVIALGTLVVPSYDGDWSVFNHYGRIIKDTMGHVTGIVEFKDASEEIRAIKEVNMSYYCFDATWLWENIDTIDNKNAAGEYYLTDIVAIAKKQQKIITSYAIENYIEAMGINTPEQLLLVESFICDSHK